jgi:hypothetical protein
MCYGNLNEPNYPAEKAERLAHKESFEKDNKMEEEKEALYKKEVTCPNCKVQVTTDSWDWADSGEYICDDCGCTFFYERDVEVTYSSRLIKLDESQKDLLQAVSTGADMVKNKGEQK